MKPAVFKIALLALFASLVSLMAILGTDMSEPERAEAHLGPISGAVTCGHGTSCFGLGGHKKWCTTAGSNSRAFTWCYQDGGVPLGRYYYTWNCGPTSVHGTTQCPNGENYNWAIWQPSLPYTTTYRVCTYVPPDHAYTHSARYQISHAAGVTQVKRDQQPFTGWWDLGEFQFNAGTSGYLFLGDYTGEGWATTQVGVSATQFVIHGGGCAGGSGLVGGLPPDADLDEWPDGQDNCTNAYNPGQENADGDGQGDACDADDDNDGFGDATEQTYGSNPLNGGSTPEGPTADAALGRNTCDGSDNDLDGSVDEAFTNTDGDGQADCIDTDDDNDVMPDPYEDGRPCLNALVADGGGDPDSDALASLGEMSLGTDPCDSDTDDDTLLDGPEVSGMASPKAALGTLFSDPLTPDTDADGCSDGREMGADETAGGRRNPSNQFDYFNPSGDGLNRVDDILMVVDAYFMDDNDANPGLPPYAAGYNPNTDRVLIGPNAWNVGAPDGLQRTDDILNIVKQYFHDCS